MALRPLPGGVIYDDKAGSRLDEPAGRNLEAIHRQLGKQSSAALDVAETALERAKAARQIVFDQDGTPVIVDGGTVGGGGSVPPVGDTVYATRAYVETKAQQAAQQVAGQAEQAQQTAAEAEQAAASAVAAAASASAAVELVRTESANQYDELAQADAALSARVTALEQAPPTTGGGDVDDAAMLADYLAARG